MKKISLILLIPFGSLIGISILFNVYNDYLKMAASQYNYDYLYICLFRLLEALILFISILVYMKDIQKEDNKLIYLIEDVFSCDDLADYEELDSVSSSIAERDYYQNTNK